MNQNLRVNKTNFHMKGFTLGLALKQRQNATRKSPVTIAYWSMSEVWVDWFDPFCITGSHSGFPGRCFWECKDDIQWRARTGYPSAYWSARSAPSCYVLPGVTKGAETASGCQSWEGQGELGLSQECCKIQRMPDFQEKCPHSWKPQEYIEIRINGVAEYCVALSKLTFHILVVE